MRFKTALNRIFCLSGRWTALVAIPSLLLVALVLAQGREDALAYFAYLFSAYGLVVALTWTIRTGKETICNAPCFQRFLARPTVNRYLTDVRFRTRVSLGAVLAVNLLYVVVNLLSGLRYHAAWFVVLALYYAFLAALRYSVFSSARRDPHGEDLLAEHRRSRLCGFILLGMNLVLSGMVLFIIERRVGYDYPGLLVFSMAAYTFYIFILAIVNLARYRKYGSPLLSAAKAISMTTALVSMLSLEVAMIDRFDSGDNPTLFRETMIGVTGAVICAAVLTMSVVMIVRSSRALKKVGR